MKIDKKIFMVAILIVATCNCLHNDVPKSHNISDINISNRITKILTDKLENADYITVESVIEQSSSDPITVCAIMGRDSRIRLTVSGKNLPYSPQFLSTGTDLYEIILTFNDLIVYPHYGYSNFDEFDNNGGKLNDKILNDVSCKIHSLMISWIGEKSTIRDTFIDIIKNPNEIEFLSYHIKFVKQTPPMGYNAISVNRETGLIEEYTSVQKNIFSTITRKRSYKIINSKIDKSMWTLSKLEQQSLGVKK